MSFFCHAEKCRKISLLHKLSEFADKMFLSVHDRCIDCLSNCMSFLVYLEVNITVHKRDYVCMQALWGRQHCRKYLEINLKRCWSCARLVKVRGLICSGNELDFEWNWSRRANPNAFWYCQGIWTTITGLVTVNWLIMAVKNKYSSILASTSPRIRKFSVRACINCFK